MKAQHCAVRECGAVVYLLPTEGGEMAVDPGPVEVLVREDDHYRLVEGYRPHWATCVDISRRARSSSAARC
jgi:hypothetical protein